jgi:hypothetical protein
MEILKKDLLIQIQEELNIDEMAAPDIEKTSWNALYSEPQDDSGEYRVRGSEHLKGTGKGKHIGHKVKDKSTGQDIVIMYPCDMKVDEFIETHKEALDKLKEIYGDYFISKNPSIPCREPRVTGANPMKLYHPETGAEVNPDTRVRFESEIKPAEYIKRYLLYPALEHVLLKGGEVNKHLEKCSLPTIKVNERAYLDRHSAFDNDVLTYQTLNFNSYKDVRDFFEAAKRNVQGVQETEDEKDYREHHMARQFNQQYRNWEKTKKTSNLWLGFTEKYNLEKSGYSANPMDVSIWSLITVEGHVLHTDEGMKYKWRVTFKTEHGKVLRDNQNLRRLELANDYQFESNETVTVTKDVNLNLKDALVKDVVIRAGLEKCLSSIREQILNIPIAEQLKRAKIVAFQLSPEEKAELRRQRQERLAAQSQGEEQAQLDESQLDMIVQNILMEIKK